MNDQETRAVGLLDRATSDLTPDVDRIVAGAVGRGRARRRRARVTTTLAAAAVIGVTGLAASLLPHASGGDGAPVAADPTASASTNPTPTPTATPTPTPTTTPSPVSVSRIAVTAEQVPSTVEELLGRQGAGPLRTGPAYGSVSEPRRVIAHFSWRGTLASVVVEPFEGDAQQACEQSVGPHYTCTADAAGHPMLLWGPTTGDGVAAQGATVWRDGFEVSVLSYNAAEGKNSPALFEQPPLTMDDLSLLAASDAWFS